MSNYLSVNTNLTPMQPGVVRIIPCINEHNSDIFVSDTDIVPLTLDGEFKTSFICNGARVPIVETHAFYIHSNLDNDFFRLGTWEGKEYKRLPITASINTLTFYLNSFLLYNEITKTKELVQIKNSVHKIIEYRDNGNGTAVGKSVFEVFADVGGKNCSFTVVALDIGFDAIQLNVHNFDGITVIGYECDFHIRLKT